MIEPNILAFQNADVLALLDEAPNGQLNKTAMAEALGRDQSNLGKTLKRLVDEGLLQSDPTAGLTDDGRAQLAAFKRAQHGGERKRARGQWPLDRFKPNPLNRPVRREALPEMAASMRGPAGLVQRVKATEPDANGVRMLIDGEHRWEAAKLVAAEGDIPDWLADGLPFEEGAAEPATALIITLVANARRADMSPWDDAQQLLKLQKATDWTASELARQIGRVSEGERTGVRDVQQKLKIAREATPEAVADYERTGSWDTLRASVTTPKAPTIGELVAEHGAAALSQPAQPDRQLLAKDFGVPADFRAHGRDFSADEGRERARAWLEPDSLETLALPHRAADKDYNYPRAQIQIARIKGSEGWIQDNGYSLSQIGNHHSLVGVFSGDTKAYATRAAAIQAGADSIREGLTRNLKGGTPKDVEAWLQQVTGEKSAPTGPHVVNGTDYGNATRANDARRALGLLPPLPTPNYGSPPRPETRPEPPAQTPAVPVSTPEDGQRPVTPEQDAPAPVTRDAAPLIPLGQVLKNMADEANERKRNGLRAVLEVLVERLEPVLTALNGDRTDGILPLDSDDADWFGEQLTEASRWAEDALAVTGVFDPLPGEEIARPDIGSPAVPIRQSITPDHIVCLFDGRKFKSLKRHLRTRYDMSPDEYRAKWKLPKDYPMVAPNYAKAREDLARQMGLTTGAAR